MSKNTTPSTPFAVGQIVSYQPKGKEPYVLQVTGIKQVGRGFRVEVVDTKGAAHSLPAGELKPSDAEFVQSKPEGKTKGRKRSIATRRTPEEVRALRADKREAGKAAIVADLSRYQSVDGHVDVGDEVALLLRPCVDADCLYDEAQKLGLAPADELRAQYKHLNFGQQRMNVGNRLRKLFRDKAMAKDSAEWLMQYAQISENYEAGWHWIAETMTIDQIAQQLVEAKRVQQEKALRHFEKKLIKVRLEQEANTKA
jgi:hypothetical protein